MSRFSTAIFAVSLFNRPLYVGNNPSKYKDCGADCPVEMVSWNDVQKFIRKLNGREGTDKYRLPTKAEWEYACRAGNTTAFANGDISKLKGGHDPNLVAMGWYCGNSGKKTHRVAEKRPNAWGLYDMHGNVMELCADIYSKDAYSKHQHNNPIYTGNGSDRVNRGGCWADQAMYCRSANRGKSGPGVRIFFLGFRLARTLD